jgi:predicted ester cyclase
MLSLVTASLVTSCVLGKGEALAPDALRDCELRHYAAMPPRYGRDYTANRIRLPAGEITYRLVFENVPSAPLLGVLLPPMYGACPG